MKLNARQALKQALRKMKSSRVPKLNLASMKKSIGQKSSIFGFTDIDPTEFGTFVSKNTSEGESFVNNFPTKRISKQKQ